MERTRQPNESLQIEAGGAVNGAAGPRASSMWPRASDPVALGRGDPLYRYMPALDGLRGVAILWVLSAHLPVTVSPVVAFCAQRGPLGVELFFAMSGLLVTRSLHQCVVRSAPGSVRRSLRDFFTRRVARIWPPYFLVLVLAIGALFTDPAFHTHFTEIRSILWSFPLFIANYLFTHHVPPFSLLIMWSLCFEEQFYVLLMIFYVLGRKHLDRWLIAGIVLSVGARLFFGWTRADWFEPFVMDRQLQWRFDALAWACLIWIWHRPIVAFFAGTPHRLLWQSLFVLGAIAVCLPDPSVPVVRAIWYVALSPVFAVLVAAVAFSPNFWLARALTWSPLVLLGVISYELYLSHFIVYRVLTRLGVGRWHMLHGAACLVVSVGVAWVFHNAFSKPIQRAVREWSVRVFARDVAQPVAAAPTQSAVPR